MKACLETAVLVALGCLQMLGDVSGQAGLKAIGAAIHVSPAPKVFTAQNGFETYSSRMYVDWQDRDGAWHAIELTPQVYRGLRGPYNRRNAYGAAISYAPVLAANPRTKPLVDQVAHYAFCGDGPLLSELRMQRDLVASAFRVRLEPRDERSRAAKWLREFRVFCE